ncbi:3-ketoacyl-ACP reductase [Arthrobacter sp. Soil782]|uniref:3-oxoacyl-ACP reductase n=1 Tax=Arthrobacter sp. Soil782 TaxID=1736410 RepID=UPI0006FDBABC|nr:3-oxoacyl-ACP reductase [Arthrobacter sp. Soil782]KRF06329.1 3-ketoacyl-ACP reductase [Arthrobacter sp. Soil782]
MTDTYLNLVNAQPLSRIAKAAGLPRPVPLRRYAPDAPLVPGPVLVLGRSRSTQDMAATLLEWNLDVRRHLRPKEKFGAAVVVLDDLAHPGELSEVFLELGHGLRNLLPGGRIVTISRPVTSEISPQTAAARQAVDGTLRSLAKELRGGATANGILLGEGVNTGAPSVRGTLEFLLSGKSAYVDGQFIAVGSDHGAPPRSAELPLAGRTAVVTGAARGIGAEIVRVLRRDGAHIIAVDVPAAGEQLAQVANHAGGTALQVDVTAPDAAERILRHAATRYGGLDIMVHNAGITRDRLLANMDQARWSSVLAVNVESQLRINEKLLSSDHFNSNGSIVCLASTSGIAGNRGQTNYAASKAGVIGMVRATADALVGSGRTINAVAPGFIETDMTARIPFATREVARRLSSLQQGGLPLDVAEAVSFLASTNAAGINGQVLRVCGQNLVGA